MSFEFLLAKDEKGLHRLRLLYLKLYFSGEPSTTLIDIKEDRKDPVLIDCVKSLLKNQETFRGSVEVWSVPDVYKDRISIGTKHAFEHFVIKDKKPDEPEPHAVHIPRSRTIAMSIFDAHTTRSPFNMMSSARFLNQPSRPKKTAFTGYWDPPKRTSITVPPAYCDDDL